MKQHNIFTHPLVIVSIILSLVLGSLALFEGCNMQSGRKSSKQSQSYLDRNVSIYVQYNSGISQKIELHRDNHTYISYDRFDVTGSSDWSISCKGSYSEEPINEDGIIQIYFNGAERLGHYRSGKIYTKSDRLVAHAPSNVFEGYYSAQ